MSCSVLLNDPVYVYNNSLLTVYINQYEFGECKVPGINIYENLIFLKKFELF